MHGLLHLYQITILDQPFHQRPDLPAILRIQSRQDLEELGHVSIRGERQRLDMVGKAIRVRVRQTEQKGNALLWSRQASELQLCPPAYRTCPGTGAVFQHRTRLVVVQEGRHARGAQPHRIPPLPPR